MAQESEDLSELLKELNHTFEQMNLTLAAIHQDNQEREKAYQEQNALIERRIDKMRQRYNAMGKKQDHRLRMLRMISIPGVIIVFIIAAPIAVHMFTLIMRMADDMNNMSGHITTMAINMDNMSTRMTTMSGDMSDMNDYMYAMSNNMGDMSVDMRSMKGDMKTMSKDMHQMSFDVTHMRAATVSMGVGVQHMTRDVGAMSNNISPVMHGFKQFMPWSTP